MTDEWRQARRESDAMFAIVREEFLYERPIAERHRIAFYVGHLEAFDWNLLRGPLKLESFAPDYDRLFAFGIDPVDGELPSDQPNDWPTMAEILAYRDRVRRELDLAVEAAGPMELLPVAIEHRHMHAETLAYIFHQMPVAMKRANPLAMMTPRVVAPAAPVTIPQGSVTLGREPDGEFGWDNEFGSTTVDVPEFRIDRYKVSNGQFLEFVEAGGYDDPALWSEDGWLWLKTHQIRHPAFWSQVAGRWHWRTMWGEIPLPTQWPVYVSHAEASAFAKWSDRALPTEAQWQRAASAEGEANVPPATESFDPCAVDEKGMIANGWEWTSTLFGPLPGFQAFDFYPGYSEPFFDGKHYVLKGGSVRTAARMLRPTFRNWFQPHYQYVYAGFRCVDKGAHE